MWPFPGADTWGSLRASCYTRLLPVFNLILIQGEQQVPSRWPFLFQKLKSVTEHCGSTKLRKSEPICTTVRPAAPVSHGPAWQKHFSCPMWTALCHSFYSVQEKTQWLELWSISHVKCASQKRQHWKVFSNQLFLLGVLHLVIWEVSRMAISR